MSDYQQHPSEWHQGQPPQEKGWFKRNWMWFVPLIILGPLFCCCGAPVLLTQYAFGKAFDTPAYKDTVAVAEKNAEVEKELGKPIKAPEGFMDMIEMLQTGGKFDLGFANGEQTFDAEIPIAGPNGTGKLIITATSTDDGQTWVYTKRHVKIDGSDKIIDLMTEEDKAKAKAKAAADKKKAEEKAKDEANGKTDGQRTKSAPLPQDLPNDPTAGGDDEGDKDSDKDSDKDKKPE